MKVLITDRVGTIPDHVKEYAHDKAANLEHYFEGTMKADLVFKSDGQQCVAEMVVSPRGGNRMFAEASAKDFQSVVDLLMDKIERQLRKFKTKRRDRKRSASGVLLIPSSNKTEDDDEVTYEDIILGRE